MAVTRGMILALAGGWWSRAPHFTCQRGYISTRGRFSTWAQPGCGLAPATFTGLLHRVARNLRNCRPDRLQLARRRFLHRLSRLSRDASVTSHA